MLDRSPPWVITLQKGYCAEPLQLAASSQVTSVALLTCLRHSPWTHRRRHQTKGTRDTIQRQVQSPELTACRGTIASCQRTSLGWGSIEVFDSEGVGWGGAGTSASDQTGVVGLTRVR
jgi:hypothetical protein